MVRALERRGRGAWTAGRAKVGSHPAQSALAWIMGSVATAAAVLLGSILAVVFAATAAVVLLLTAALMAVAAAAWRLNQLQPQPARVIEARKVGHSWVAYGWDRRS